ncbi:alpha-1,2-fucosyltransferase [uncultured Desulfovibrio sp.]|uniref:alpha-1,2-fucosyltransferase n=1 Tax=uncultured Desulfovibrio sp. TaxID=167968 RepID=UPI00261D996F|nr:alpha-1,2-fucosyltransferase [uncultured Desulfovibrio sp.]
MSFSIDVAAIQRMALVKVDGGLGSQMWQYALSLAVGKGSSFTVKHDLSWFRHYAKDIRGVENRFFILNSVFTNINLRLPSENERLFFHIALNRYPDSICNFDPDILALKQPTYLGGYYVNAQYVTSAEKEIREAYVFAPAVEESNLDMLQAIHAAPMPVAVHVRRGDYIGSMHEVLTPRYFERAFKILAAALQPKPTFFVFSNGMEWTKKAFAGLPYDFVYVDANDNDNVAGDLFLMTQCKHFIISNSSLSWWGGLAFAAGGE